MFYLNAIYKKDFQCSDEEAEENARRHKQDLKKIIPQPNNMLECYMKQDNGMWSRDSLKLVNFNQFPDRTVSEGAVNAYLNAYSVDNSVVYINFDPLFKQLENEYFEEKRNESQPVDDSGETSETVDNSDKYKIYEIYLDPIYNDFMEDTVQVARSLDDNSRALLENGVEKVYKCKKLLNYTSFHSFCENQKKIIADIGSDIGASEYLDNWIIHIINGPKKMPYQTNFKNLKKNPYKPNIDTEIKKIEEDVENGGKCPKYFKKWISYEDAYDEAYAQITADEYNGAIKSSYISKGGIWITNATSNQESARDEDEPIDSEGPESSTPSAEESATSHIPPEDKYKVLWEKCIDEYIPTKIQQLGWEYDPSKKDISLLGGVCTEKSLNPDWPYKALYIDTLNYNPWMKYLEELKVLYTKYSQLPDQMPPTDNTDPKKEDGEEYDPVCDKYYPIDYQRMLGLPALLPPLMTVPVVDYNISDNTVKFKFEINDYNAFVMNMARRDVPVSYSYWIQIIQPVESDPDSPVDSEGPEQEATWEQKKEVISDEDELAKIYKQSDYAPVETWTETNWQEGTVKTYNLVNIASGSDAEEIAGHFGKKNTIDGKVGLKDGYAYVPLGINITCQYTGIPIYKNSVLIPGIGFDYGTTLAGVYSPYTGTDRKLVLYYPYVNEDPDGQFYWLQDSFINPFDIIKLKDMFTDPNYKPLLVKFIIFEKFKLECGYPKKSGEMTAEEYNINGKCGLQEFLKNPPNITPELMNRKQVNPKEIYMDVLDSFKKWKQNLKDKLNENWDIAKRLKENLLNKKFAMQNFMDMANSMFPAMGFIDTNCLKNTICETQRKAAGNSIEDMSDTLKNNAEATKLLLDNVTDNIEKAANNLVGSIGDFGKTAWDGLVNLTKSFSIYQLCPRRFNDWLKDAGEAMGLPIGINPFTQLQNIFSAGIIGVFKDLLGDCMKNNLIDNFINDAKNISSSQKQQLLSTFKSRRYGCIYKCIKRYTIKKSINR